MAYAAFPAGTAPDFTVTSQFATRDYFVDLSLPGSAPKMSETERTFYLAPTKLQPTDGIVRDTALRITKGATTDQEKSRAIYEWVVENTFRDPKTRGCGLGDIRFMLESGDLGGKCADLNALFVGLARAGGECRRGMRTDCAWRNRICGIQEPGTFDGGCDTRAALPRGSFSGWIRMGAGGSCGRTEGCAGRAAWTFDVNDEPVKKARARLFGAWEMNWWRTTSRMTLICRARRRGTLPFLMYTQGETGGAKIDPYDQENFKYSITSKELTGTDAAKA